MSAALDIGHARARDAADHAGKAWGEAALDAIIDYARENVFFTVEEVRQWAVDLPAPPDLRAWGAVAKRAERLGVTRFYSWKRARSLTVHGMVVAQWLSLIVREDRS